MPTILNKSDSANPYVVVNDGQLNNDSTSLTFLGKNYPQGYSQPIGENFLHLLENFASIAEPNNPIQGQIWFNTNSNQIVDPGNSSTDVTGTFGLKVYDGSNWLPIGIVKKSATPPSNDSNDSNALNTGDLFVDTSRNQLYIKNASGGYNLVGPTFNAFEKTGLEIEEIINSTDNQPVSVITVFVKARRVAIISDKDFTPKLIYDGFKNIKQGFNLSSAASDTNTKYWGTSEKALALTTGDEVIPAANFLRSDVLSTTNYGLNIRSASGLNMGNDLSFNISYDTSGAYLYNKNAGSKIDFRIKREGNSEFFTPLRVTSNEITGGRVGVNNTAPQESLDVVGNVKVSGTVSTNNLVTQNNLTVVNYLNLENDLKFKSDLTINLGNITDVANILPRDSGIFDLGSPTKKWDRLYVSQIGDASSGSVFFGSVKATSIDVDNGAGTINAYSKGLTGSGVTIQTEDTTSDVTFKTASDPTIPIRIKNSPETLTIKTQIGSSFISGKPPTNFVQSTDQFLIQSNDNQFFRVSRRDLSKSMATVPTGTVILMSGDISALPDGYELCDGRLVRQTLFSDLWNNVYKNQHLYRQITGSEAGSFYLPDLRSSTPNFSVTELKIGIEYVITELGSTVWSTVGVTGTAQENTVFTATATGTGTGRVRLRNGLHYIIYTGKI